MSQDSCEDEYQDPTQHPSPVPIKEGQTTANITEAHRQKPKRSFLRALTGLNVLFNGILAITTFGLGLIGYWQLEATNEAVKISERTMQLAQRAYVSVQKLESRLGQRGVFLYLQNTGVIPADNVRIHVLETRKETKTMKTIREHSFDLNQAHNFISKDSPYPIPIELLDFQSNEISRILAGEEQLFIAGDVKYTDGIRDDEHTVPFAYRFFPLDNREIWLPHPVIPPAGLTAP